jgi:SAM-dependent methyltransferase
MAEHKPQTPPHHYWSRAYNTKERFCSFWHQLDETLGLEPRSVLEVGPGSGLVTDWLLRADIQVTTLDVDTALRPDAVGSVTSIPFNESSFDVVLCGEVLEHLPWEEAEQGLIEVGRVARVGAVISLPDVTPWVGKAYPLYFGLYAEDARRRLGEGRVGPMFRALRGKARWRDVLWTQLVPAEWGLGGRAFELKHPPVPHRPWRHEFDGEHYWEIGTEGFPVSRIRDAIAAAGLSIVKDFRVPENPWHHFFSARVSS